VGTKMEFTDNYNDQSTDRGFQFEFYCDRCGTGYRTRFQPWATGTAASVLDTASSLFGGIFSSAANVGERVRSAAWQKAHDEAFLAAMEELRPDFIQCPRCQQWVCREKCWNRKRGLCKTCAPDLAVERSAAQASLAVEQAWSGATIAEDDERALRTDGRETVLATCPNCEAPLAANAKFCPECGTPLKVKTECANCGAEIPRGAKFCPECGTPAGGAASPKKSASGRRAGQ